MYPSVKREIPDFIINYVLFCDCFVDVYRQKTCLVLTRNLKFFEFHQKQLMTSMDLAKTCLNKVKDALHLYKGPNGKLQDSSSASAENNSAARSSFDSASVTASAVNVNSPDICIGKYVFHSLNVMKVYIIIQCWDKCVILQRLPNFKGFTLKTEYEGLRSFRIVHGSIKYCPVLELELQNKAIIRTDLEEDSPKATDDASDFCNKKTEFKLLLERVRSAKTELQLHESITAHSFERLQNMMTYGLPCIRSLKLEEKQMLARCGDIWKRLTPQHDLVIGIPLVNQCAPPNLTILYNLQPLLGVDPSLGASINFEYRLFQLKQAFNQLDSIETFLQSEDEQLQSNVWSSSTKCQLLPESFVILVIKFKISQIITIKQCPLLLHYEVSKDYYASTTTTPLQIFLQTIDFYEIFYEQRSKYALTFQSETLQQDFLTVAMSSHETCLKITFKHHSDLEIFESCLQQKFEFVKLPMTFTEDSWHHTVFYNHLRNSLWFGCLCLRFNEIEENEHDHYITSWKLYCPNGEKTVLFIKILLNDLITLQCNVVSIDNMNKTLKDVQRVGEFENALREELHILKQLTCEEKTDANFETWSKLFMDFVKAQMNSDILIKQLKQTVQQ